jgi:hypothetical protein
MAHCHVATVSSFSTKVRGKVFAHFHAVVTVVRVTDFLACQDEMFVKNPLDVKESYEHALDFALHISRLFQSALNRACHSNSRVWIMLSSPF